MKKVFILLVVFSLSAFKAVGHFPDKKDVTGEWKFSCPEAPYGYQSGILNFELKKGDLEGDVNFDDGYKIDLTKVELKDQELILNLYVDYELITVKLTVDEDKLTGHVNSSQGRFSVTAVRKE